MKPENLSAKDHKKADEFNGVFISGRKWLDLPMSSYVLQGLTVSLWSRLQLRRCSIHNHWATMIRRKITHQHADIMACWFPCETTSHFLWVQSCFIICDALYHLPIAAPLYFWLRKPRRKPNYPIIGAKWIADAHETVQLPYNCTHFTCQQDYAQNPSS